MKFFFSNQLLNLRLPACLFVLLCLNLTSCMNADEPVKSDAAKTKPASGKTELATFGGGCFWCTEALVETLPGVIGAVSGYAGGANPNPSYEQVCSGRTGHAEVIQVEYDPATISYAKLLETFWRAHDPTTLNQQGADKGTQYRSVIFYHDDAQKQLAQASKKEAAGKFSSPIVTELVPLTKFYPAEDYHQDYFKKNPNAGYCSVVIKPKLEKFKKF